MRKTIAVKCYRDLTVWQRAMELVATSYNLATSFPRAELYGLTAQLKRAAISVPANIAEGHGRMHTGDYLRHVSIARGSLMELETHVLLAERLRFIRSSDSQGVLSLSAEVSRMLAALLRRLRIRRSHADPGPSPLASLASDRKPSTVPLLLRKVFGISLARASLM